MLRIVFRWNSLMKLIIALEVQFIILKLLLSEMWGRVRRLNGAEVASLAIYRRHAFTFWMLNKNVLKDLCLEENDFSCLPLEGINSHLNTNLMNPMAMLTNFLSFIHFRLYKSSREILTSCSITLKCRSCLCASGIQVILDFIRLGLRYSQSLKTGSVKVCECVNQWRKEKVWGRWGKKERWQRVEAYMPRASWVSLYQLSCSPTSYSKIRILTNSIYFYPSFGTGRWKGFTGIWKLSCL